MRHANAHQVEWAQGATSKVRQAQPLDFRSRFGSLLEGTSENAASYGLDESSLRTWIAITHGRRRPTSDVGSSSDDEEQFSSTQYVVMPS